MRDLSPLHPASRSELYQFSQGVGPPTKLSEFLLSSNLNSKSDTPAQVYNSSAKISIQKQLLNGTSQSYLKQPTLTSTSTTTLTLTRLTINFFFTTLYHFNLPPHSHPHPQPTSNIKMPILKADRTAIAAAIAAARADSSLPMTDAQAYATIERVFPAATNPHALRVGMPQTSGDVQGVDGEKPSMDPPPPVVPAPAPARKKIIIKLIVRRSPSSSPLPEPEPVKKGKKSRARGSRGGNGMGRGRGKSAARVAAAFPDPNPRIIMTRSQTRKLRLVAEQR
ncbi:hypothetical protein DL95DRAFT_407291 [Leptodontidium sp. 2 PMI_412]|nr:hypothetical protein DL95DRAFT_407291 [Leptodontidium sp. 2 PMI_412]